MARAPDFVQSNCHDRAVDAAISETDLASAVLLLVGSHGPRDRHDFCLNALRVAPFPTHQSNTIHVQSNQRIGTTLGRFVRRTQCLGRLIALRYFRYNA